MSIGKLIHEYEEAKREYQFTCEALKAKAVELGMDSKVSEDVRMCLAYLSGHKANSRPGLEVMKMVLDLLDNKKYSTAAIELDGYIRKNGGWK